MQRAWRCRQAEKAPRGTCALRPRKRGTRLRNAEATSGVASSTASWRRGDGARETRQHAVGAGAGRARQAHFCGGSRCSAQRRDQRPQPRDLSAASLRLGGVILCGCMRRSCASHGGGCVSRRERCQRRRGKGDSARGARACDAARRRSGGTPGCARARRSGSAAERRSGRRRRRGAGGEARTCGAARAATPAAPAAARKRQRRRSVRAHARCRHSC
jgi:hypothetical protein